MLFYFGGIGVVGYFYLGILVKKGEGIMIYFVVFLELKDVMGWVEKVGGEVVFDVIIIFVGLFFYVIDMEGNFFGVFKVVGN